MGHQVQDFSPNFFSLFIFSTTSPLMAYVLFWIVYISYNMVRELVHDWGLHVGLWFSSVLDACLRWICNDVFVVEFQVSIGIVPFSPFGKVHCTVRKT